MTTEQILVKNFMREFQQEVPSKPCIPSYEVRKLRAQLILEEAIETIEALGFKLVNSRLSGIYLSETKLFSADKIDWLTLLADGLCDIHYVGYCGTGVACGLDMEPLFAEVHRSNMTKLWTCAEVSVPDELPTTYEVEQINQHHPTDINKRCYLVRNKYGKVIKSPSYTPANLKPLIEAQMK